MNEQFKYLFTPLKVGPVIVTNRIAMPGIVTLFAGEKGLPSETLVNYFEARAKGGVGLIINEATAIHPSCAYPESNIRGYDETCIPGLKRISDAVHQYNTKIFCQLWHPGRQSGSAANRRPLWAPSPIPCAAVRETPHEMEIEQIKEVIQGFALSARNVKAAGYDGVEIHGSHGYLIQQFMSPFSNKRDDEYGGSLDNRLRFAIEVIEAVRETVGGDFAVGMRIAGDELVPGGLTVKDMKEIAPRLEATGKLDYISVSIANYSNQTAIIPPFYFPLGFNVQTAAAIRETVKSIPVFAAGRINDPVQAEKILAGGQADMVVMGRALLADPELPNKARQGRLDDIRPCIACNQGCVARVGVNCPVSCLQNPAVGKEKESGILEPARIKKKILVVGGGPGGMKAAETAALRGHEVVLYEKEKELGGQVNLAIKVPGRDEFGGCIRYLIKQMDKLAVKVHLKKEVTIETVKAENPDVVVVATGSTPLIPPIPGADQPDVLTVWDVFQGNGEIGEKVVLVDGGEGHWQCCGTAEYLAEKGRRVEIITPMPIVGIDLALTLEMQLLYQRLFPKGVVFSPHTALKKISGNSVVVFNVYTNTERTIEGVDTVVLAMGNRANDHLYRGLKGQVKELYGVGDCVAPRKALEAIYEGYNVGRIL